MDTTELDDAYRRLLAAAEALGDPAGLDAQSRETVDWTPSHLALRDRVRTAAAGDVLAGRPATVDNRGAMDAGAVAVLVASTTHTGRVPGRPCLRPRYRVQWSARSGRVDGLRRHRVRRRSGTLPGPCSVAATPATRRST